MRTFDSMESLASLEGESLGVGSWRTIDQARIDRFAAATDDHQWIHVDAERTRRELDMPTVAHGYLTLSLLSAIVLETFSVEGVSRTINYGADKIRFTNMVREGSRVRGRVGLLKAVLKPSRLRITLDATIEIEGESKAALRAEPIFLLMA